MPKTDEKTSLLAAEAVKSKCKRFTYTKAEAGGADGCVVVLIGWLACTRRYLMKYEDFYLSEGCSTVSYTPTHLEAVFQGQGQTLAANAYRFLKENNLTSRPLVSHVFSGNGTMAFSWLSEELSKNALSFKGNVFDSSPPDQAIDHFFDLFKTPLCGCFNRSVIHALWFVISGDSRRENYWQRLDNLAKSPQLFLYSSKDKMCSFKDIEAYMERRGQQGIDVSCKKWADTPHVGHFRQHGDDYKNLAVSFVRKCL